MKTPKNEPLTIRQRGTGQNTIDLLEYQERDFKVQKTSNTTRIDLYDVHGQIELKYFYSIEDFSFKHLHYVKKIREEIQKNLDKIKGKKAGENLLNINYNAYADRLRMKHEQMSVKHFKNVAEADITKAYYQTAKNLGLISETFYNECLTLPKNERLRLLGTIATQKYITEYKKGKKKDLQIKVDKDLRRAWFIICDHVAEVMGEIAEQMGPSFLF